MTDAPLTCHYCQRLLSPERTWTYRARPEDPLRIFCTPDCRDDYVDGYGLTAADWTPDEGAPP